MCVCLQWKRYRDRESLLQVYLFGTREEEEGEIGKRKQRDLYDFAFLSVFLYLYFVRYNNMCVVCSKYMWR